MKLNKPKNMTFIIAVIIALVAVIAEFVKIPVISPYAFWVLLIGFVLLAAGNYFKGL
jgi:hypothetical protein